MNGQKKSWDEILRDLDRALKHARPRRDQQSKPGAGGTVGQLGRRIASAIGRMSKRSKAVALTTTFGAACVLKLSGCGREVPGSVTVAAETFRSPTPEGAGDDPPVAGASSTGDAISVSLAVIHERLRDLESAYRDKGRIEGDLKEVAEQMRPLIAAARTDCDAIHRAAKDLRVQLPIVQVGYASAAASYRQRAEGYQDPDLKAITLGLAQQFDWLSADTPRRIALTERFLKELEDTQSFLAETERCLRDTETALAIFSGGAKLPPVSTDSRAFSHRLGQFISVVLEYEEKLLETPPTTKPPAEVRRAAEQASPPPALPAPKPVASPTPAPGAAVKQASTEDVQESEPLAESDTLLLSKLLVDTRVEAPAARTRFASSRTSGNNVAQQRSLLPVGSRLQGEITTSAHASRNLVRLEVIERSGDTFAGVMHYSGSLAVGRRGVRGIASPDGRRLSFWAEWYEGNLSPEAIRYELTRDAGGFSGSWSTMSLKGTIRLGLGPG